MYLTAEKIKNMIHSITAAIGFIALTAHQLWEKHLESHALLLFLGFFSIGKNSIRKNYKEGDNL